MNGQSRRKACGRPNAWRFRSNKRATHLRYHHVAVKGSSSVSAGRAAYVWPDLGDDGGSKRHVGHKVTIHIRKMSASRTVQPWRFHSRKRR
jgi:hypothetical protein